MSLISHSENVYTAFSTNFEYNINDSEKNDIIKNVPIRIVQLGECSHIMHLCNVTSMKQNITSTAYYFNSRAFMLSKVYSSVDIRRKNK